MNKIYKHHGLKETEMTRTSEENIVINQEYLTSGIKLGILKDNPKLENLFLEKFGEYDTPIFIYSNFPEVEIGMGGGEDLSHLIFDLFASITSDITINFLSNIIITYGPEIFKKLKTFLLEINQEKPNTIIININNEFGASASYKLPKFLEPKEIETAIDRIESLNGDEKKVVSRVYSKVTFDRKSEDFQEE